jgi:hypothetical protein
MRNGEKADDECQMADDECQMANGEGQVPGGEPVSPIQNPQSPIQNAEKAPNKANLGSEQILDASQLKSETTVQDGREQSQSREAVASADGVVGNPESAIQNPKSSGVLRALLAGGNPLVSTVRGRGPR